VLLEKGIEVLEEGSEAYGINTLAEVDSTAEYIGASLRSLSNFRVFSAFSMFYFAAASYSEMARRLDKRHLVTRFLAADRSEFRAGMRRSIELMPQVIADPTEHNLAALERQVADAIACLNIAGLADPCKGNWYGVDLQDVVDGASLLEMTPQEMTATLSVADWV
jgi:FADH2 O2-dependent halogenase